MGNDYRRQHYIPKLYLKRWICKSNNKLWHYRRNPYTKKIEEKLRGIREVGYQEYAHTEDSVKVQF